MAKVLAHPYLNPIVSLKLNSTAYAEMMLPLISARRVQERATEAELREIGAKRRAGGSAAISVAWKTKAGRGGMPAAVYRSLSPLDGMEEEEEETPVKNSAPALDLVQCTTIELGAMKIKEEVEEEEDDDDADGFFAVEKCADVVLRGGSGGGGGGGRESGVAPPSAPLPLAAPSPLLGAACSTPPTPPTSAVRARSSARSAAAAPFAKAATLRGGKKANEMDKRVKRVGAKGRKSKKKGVVSLFYYVPLHVVQVVLTI